MCCLDQTEGKQYQNMKNIYLSVHLSLFTKRCNKDTNFRWHQKYLETCFVICFNFEFFLKNLVFLQLKWVETKLIFFSPYLFRMCRVAFSWLNFKVVWAISGEKLTVNLLQWNSLPTYKTTETFDIAVERVLGDLPNRIFNLKPTS